MNGGLEKLHLQLRNVADHIILGGEGGSSAKRNGKCEVYSMTKIGGCNDVM